MFNADFGDIGLSPTDSHGTFSVTGAVQIPIFQGGRIRGRLLEADADLRGRRNEADDLKDEEGLLLRAADLIGQLGDPNYIRKSNALFHEFEEIGLNKKLGYATPADIVYKFPQFYFSNVAPQIQQAIRYLNVTSRGRQWIANLHSNVFRAEREVNLSGPQR